MGWSSKARAAVGPLGRRASIGWADSTLVYAAKRRCWSFIAASAVASPRRARLRNPSGTVAPALRSRRHSLRKAVRLERVADCGSFDGAPMRPRRARRSSSLPLFAERSPVSFETFAGKHRQPAQDLFVTMREIPSVVLRLCAPPGAPYAAIPFDAAHAAGPALA